jgi:hypothetical protein
METEKQPPIKLENYTPVRLVWGIKKDSGEMEGRLCETKNQIEEVRKLFKEWKEYKLVEIR